VLLRCGCYCSHGGPDGVAGVGCCHRYSSSDGGAMVMVTVMVLPQPLPCCKGADVGVVVVRALVPWQQQRSKALM
jgi:hypothetical protein